MEFRFIRRKSVSIEEDVYLMFISMCVKGEMLNYKVVWWYIFLFALLLILKVI